MKKFFAMAAFAALTMAGMTSCSNDDVIETGDMPSSSIQKNNAISFYANQDGALSTRGTATTADNFLDQIEDFQVIGYYNDGSGLYVGSAANSGTIIEGDGEGAWEYKTATQKQYWPSKTLDFQAVTPATDNSFTLSNTPVSGSPRLVANVTVPTDVTAQKDIMFASAIGVNNATTGTAVGLTFKHALSQVVFSGKVASTNITAIVDEIEVCNLYGAGTVGYASAVSTLAAAATGETTADFKAGLVTGNDDAATLAARTMTTTEPINLTAANGALMMIPQSRAAWTHTAPEKAITDATGAYLRVRCKVKDNGGTWLIGAEEESTDGADDDWENVYIPFDLTTTAWTLGNKYTYTLVFGNGSGGYDENGDPLTNLVPITYTVSAADNWGTVDGGNIAF